MVMIKFLHVTCVTCNMSHMLHVTNIKLQTILLKTPCVIYFWKAHVKYSSMVLIKALHVTHHNATSCRQLNVESTSLCLVSPAEGIYNDNYYYVHNRPDIPSLYHDSKHSICKFLHHHDFNLFK